MKGFRIACVVVLLGAASLFLWNNQRTKPRPTPPVEVRETIPPGIIVTESSSAPPPSAASATGDRWMMEYADPNQSPDNDMKLMARAVTDFLVVNKQAVERPLSANEEWSSALRGLRPGSESWLSERPNVFDAQHRLIDRWGTPLFFHALGGKRWEIHSAGPDRKHGTPDDLVEAISG